MNNKPTLLCLFGGKSTEYEISLRSVTSILENVDREKYNVVTVGITKDGRWYYYTGSIEAIRDGSWCDQTDSLREALLSPSFGSSELLILDGDKVERMHIDVIFPVMHGGYSEDGKLQGLLEMTGIPFVGNKCTTSAIAMDKGFTKLILKNLGIPQAKSIIVRGDALENNFDKIRAGCEKLSGYPLFVKPANGGSSVGTAKVKNAAELRDALERAALIDKKIIVEEFITAKECEVAIMGNSSYTASTVGQINSGSAFYDYDAKYASDSQATYNIPADIKPETATAIRNMAKQICSVLGVEGLSRVDFFVRTKDGREEIIFNEINTLPGFTSISMYPKLFCHDGMTYSEIIDRLCDLALGKEA